MVDAQHFYELILNPVDNDVRQSWENQFASAFDPPGAATARKVL